MPHRPGAPTRTLFIGPLLARVAGTVALVGLVMLGTALSAGHQSTLAAMDEAAEARLVAARLGDSLHVLEAFRDSVAGARALSVAPPVSAAPAAPAKPVTKALAAPRHRLISFIPAGHAREALVADEGVVLPVAGRITSGFTNRRLHPILGIIRPHKGVDLAAPTGTAITAPASGIVHFVGRRFGAGLVVELEHADGVITRYDHCRRAFVREGQRVDQGAEIATVGNSGLSTGPHLHFEVLVHGTAVDPLHFHVNGLGASVAPVPATAAESAPRGMGDGGAGAGLPDER